MKAKGRVVVADFDAPSTVNHRHQPCCAHRPVFCVLPCAPLFACRRSCVSPLAARPVRVSSLSVRSVREQTGSMCMMRCW